jgi:hypothetical protein
MPEPVAGQKGKPGTGLVTKLSAEIMTKPEAEGAQKEHQAWKEKKPEKPGREGRETRQNPN